MNTYRYSITSHVTHRLGKPPARLYDAVATCRENGLKTPLGCTNSRDEAKALCDAHRAKHAVNA